MRSYVLSDVMNRGCEGRGDVAGANKESRIIITYLYALSMTKTLKLLLRRRRRRRRRRRFVNVRVTFS